MTVHYKEEDIEAAVKQIQDAEDAEWIRLVGALFFKPVVRTTNNRKKKRNINRK